MGLQEEVGKGQAYQPFTGSSDVPEANRRQGPYYKYGHGGGDEPIDRYMYNPFITHPAGREKLGKFTIYGGKQDLLGGVATRSMAIEGIKGRMAQEAVPTGLQDSLRSYAADNPYLMSMLESQQPGIQASSLIQNQQNQAELRDMMYNNYVTGGGLYGSAVAAEAETRKLKREYDKAKTQRLQAIVGGAMRGLGLNQYGEADTTEGFIGGLEM